MSESLYDSLRSLHGAVKPRSYTGGKGRDVCVQGRCMSPTNLTVQPLF